MTQELINQLQQFVCEKVPMIGLAGLEIMTLDDNECVVKIPFKPENRNHVNSMYFGALSVGADGAGGLLAQYQIIKNGLNTTLLFKDFKANFLKRPEGDVYFVCKEGQKVKGMLDKVAQTGERVSEPVHVDAFVGSPGDVKVAEFELTLSLK